MHEQEQVKRFDEIWVGDILFAWDREHHVEEVLAVVQRVVGIDKGLSKRLLVAVGCDCRELGDQTMDRYLDFFWVVGIQGVLIERRECADDARKNRHGVGVAWKSVVERTHVLMEHGVVRDVRSEFIELLWRGQFAVDQQVARFEEIAFFGELFDGVSTVAENSAIPVEIRDSAARRAGVCVALVEGDVPGLF